MGVEVREVRTRRELRAFIRLPFALHRGHSGWVPPLYGEDWRYFRPGTNRAFAFSDAVLALAWRGGSPAGRIMGIVNHRYNRARGESRARFGFLECANEPATAAALLGFVEGWGRGKGLDRVVGPLGFSDQDPQGFLIEGFEHEPAAGTNFNYPFMSALVEGAGYAKDMDYVVYRVDLRDGVPGFYRKIAERAAARKICRLKEYASRRELERDMTPILALMNECFRELYGYHELDEREMFALGKRFLPVLDPRFVKTAVSGPDIVGFNVAMPNLAPGFRRAKGRLFPFGLLWILRAGRKAKQLDSLVGGIRAGFRGKGVDAILGCATMASAISAGFEFVDTHHELEYNRKVRGEMEKLGGVVYKRQRVYGKDLWP